MRSSTLVSDISRSAGTRVPRARRGWTDLRDDHLAAAAVVYLCVVVAMAMAASRLTPFGYDEQHLEASLQGSSWHHVLGTDNYGRDLLTRVAFGARISLTVAALAVSAEVALGVGWGTAAGFFGGRLDGWMMRVVDLFIAFPALLLAILITGIFGPNLANIVVALVVTAWPGMARVVRSEVVSLREREFVELAVASGASSGRVIWRHLIPNVWHIVAVRSTLDAGIIILLEATLSFVGVGVQPPHPSWGLMINEAFAYLRSDPYMLIVPTIVLSLTVLSLNVLGESLAERLDPRGGRR